MGGRRATLYTLNTLYTFYTKEKGNLKRAKREKGKPKKTKREKVGNLLWFRIPLANQTARTHALHDTKRFPGWTHPPTSDLCFQCYMHGFWLV